MKKRTERLVGVVIPVGPTTPQWQINECVAAIVATQDPKHRGDMNCVPMIPAHHVLVVLALGQRATPAPLLPGITWDDGLMSMDVVTGSTGSFSANVNRGVRHALDAGSEMVVVLNADAHLFPGQIEEWILSLELNPTVAICGCVSNYIGGEQLRDCADIHGWKDCEADALEHHDWEHIADEAEYSLYRRAVALSLRCLRNFRNHLQDNRDVKMVAAAFPAWAFERVGMLDERFRPGNREDVDWCWRARQAGFRTTFSHAVFVHHYGSTSFKDDDAWRKAMDDNRGRFNAKWSHSLRFQIESQWRDSTIDPRRVVEAMDTEEAYSIDPLYWHALCVSAARPRAGIRDLEAYLGRNERDLQGWALLVECLSRVGRHEEALNIISDMRCWFPLSIDGIDMLQEMVLPRKEPRT